MDKLERIFEMQTKLQERLGNTKEKMFKNQEFINIMTIACIDELMESIRETPWKPWKKQQVFNLDNYKKELIDLWHFVINLSLASGMSADDIFNEYYKKNKINFERQDTGY